MDYVYQAQEAGSSVRDLQSKGSVDLRGIARELLAAEWSAVEQALHLRLGHAGDVEHLHAHRDLVQRDFDVLDVRREISRQQVARQILPRLDKTSSGFSDGEK